MNINCFTSLSIVLLVLAMQVNCAVFGQDQRELDSLYAVLPHTSDTNKVRTLQNIARIQFFRGKTDTSFFLSRQSLNLAKRLKYNLGVVFAYRNLALTHWMHYNDFRVPELFLDSAKQWISAPKHEAYICSALGRLFAQKGDLEKSYGYLIHARELMPERHAYEVYEIHSLLGYVLNLLGRYREAIQFYKTCIHIAEVKLTNRELGVALGNLGVPYIQLGEYDSALTILNKLYRFELDHGNPLLNAGLLSNLGRVYSKIGHLDTAYYFMHTGLRAARTMHIPYAITHSLSTLGQHHLLYQRADSALYYGRMLLRQVNKSASPDMESALFIMANAHGKLKRYDSSYYYYNEYLVYHDSVFQVKQIQQIAALEAQFKLREKQQEISRLEAEKKAEVVKRNALAAGLTLTVIIAVLMYVYLRSRVRARKREIEIKNWQIEQFTRKMVEKSALAENLRTQLEHLKSDITVPRERIENLSQILNSPILTDDDWNQFKALFEQVHRNFFATLKLKYPTLTQAETRLAALLRLNLTTREMANMLGISADSANKARYRLRKKLELHPEQDLQEIFEQTPHDGNKE